MRTIQGTRREDIEMMGTLNSYRNACFHLHDRTLNADIKNYMEQLTAGRGYVMTVDHTIKARHPTSSIQAIAASFPDRTLQFFSTCVSGRVRFTTMEYSKSKTADDSVICFHLGDQIMFGIIVAIFTDDEDETFLQVWPLTNGIGLHTHLDQEAIDFPMIQEGVLLDDSNFYYVPMEKTIEKCILWKSLETKKAIFFVIQIFMNAPELDQLHLTDGSFYS